MATIVTRYLDGASAGGDGTTNALSGAGAAYASFSAWQTAELKDLVTANEIHKLICSGSGVSETFRLTGWTTDIDHFVWVTVDSTSRHTGIPGTGFKITGTAVWSHAFAASQDYTVVEWLESVGTLTMERAFNHSKNALLVGCIGSSANTDGFDSADSSSTCISCLSFNCAGSGFNSGNYDSVGYLNCTSAGNSVDGFNRAGTAGASPKAINCVSFNNIISDYVSDDSWTVSTDYNASEDLTAPGTTVVTGIVAGDFTNAAGNDYSLASGSSLAHAGTSIETELTALDRTQYTVPRLDLAGNASGTDIGAFAAVAGGALIAVQSAINSHRADNVALSQFQGLTVQNAGHVLTNDVVITSQAQIINPANVSHSTGSDNITLSQGQTLTAADSAHGVTSDSAALSQGLTLSGQDSGHGLNSDSATLALIQALTVLNATHGLVSGKAIFNPVAIAPSGNRILKATSESRTAFPSTGNRTTAQINNRTLRI